MIASDILKWNQFVLAKEIEDYIVHFGYIQGSLYILIWDKQDNFKGGCWAGHFKAEYFRPYIDSDTFFDKCLIVSNRIEKLKAFI